jgi:hypothetical protein
VKKVFKNITEGKIFLKSQYRVVLKMLKVIRKKWVLEAGEK